MASRSLGTLYVDFVAKTSGFETDMGRASRLAKRRAKEIDKAIAEVNRNVGATLTNAAIAVAAGVAGIALAVKSAVNEMDQLGKSAQKVGVTTEVMSALQYAAKLAEVEIGSLESSMTKLAKAQADAAQGGEQQLEIFRLLGVEFKNADGTLRNTGDVFADVADRFSTMRDGAEKTALAVKLFGRSGANLIPLLNGGADGLRRAADEAERFGLIVSDDAARAADEFNDNLDRLGQVSKGAALEVATSLLPTLTDLSQQVVEMAKDPAFRSDLANSIKIIGEAAITATVGVVNFSNAMGFLYDEVRQAAGVVDANDIVRLNEELDEARQELQLRENQPAFFLGITSEADAARAEVERLEQAIASAEARLQRGGLGGLEEVDLSGLRRLPTDPPVLRDTAAADRAAAEAATAARRQARELAEEQKQATQIVRDLKLQALGEEARAVAALQDQYGDLNRAVELGVVSQEEAARIAAGLAEQWQDTSTQELRLSLLSDEERAVAELQAEYIRLQNLVQSGALTPEEGAGTSSQLAERWASEQEELRDQQLESLSAGLLTEEEMIAASYDARREAILEATKLTEDEKTDLLVRAEAERAQSIADLERMRLNDQLDQTAYYLSAVATLMNSGNSKLFAIGKAAAIAEATVKGYQAVQNALAEVPYPLNFAAAAAVTAATAVQIANIASTNYQGGYDLGGDIAAGKFGLVGENGPELVSGPVSVTGRARTASLLEQAASGSSEGMRLRQIIVFGDDAIEGALGSDASERAFITHASRNRSKLRQILG